MRPRKLVGLRFLGGGCGDVALIGICGETIAAEFDFDGRHVGRGAPKLGTAGATACLGREIIGWLLLPLPRAPWKSPRLRF